MNGLSPAPRTFLALCVRGPTFSVMSDSLWPCGFPCPWGFPGKNTGVGNHYLLQGIFLTQGSNSSLCLAGRFFTIWATKKPAFSALYHINVFTAYLKYVASASLTDPNSIHICLWNTNLYQNIELHHHPCEFAYVASQLIPGFHAHQTITILIFFTID